MTVGNTPASSTKALAGGSVGILGATTSGFGNWEELDELTTELGSCVGWFDFSTSDNLFDDAARAVPLDDSTIGQIVSGITDKSGTTNLSHLSGIDDNSGPTLILNAQNGLAVAHFTNTTGEALNGPAAASSDICLMTGAFTVVVIASLDAAASSNGSFISTFSRTVANNTGFTLNHASSGTEFRLYTGDGASGSNNDERVSGSTFSTTALSVVAITIDALDGDAFWDDNPGGTPYFHTTAVTTPGDECVLTGATDDHPVAIGSRADAQGNDQLHAYVGEIIVYDEVLDTEQLIALMGIKRMKWGI